MLLFLFSCNNNESKKKENTYQIINLLTEDVRRQSISKPFFPELPNTKEYKHTIKDSLNTYKYFYKEFNRKWTIAYNKHMQPASGDKFLFKQCKIDSDIIQRVKHFNRVEEIDISNIFTSYNDSLIYYTKEKEKSLGKGFIDIDFLMNFSSIVYNKDYTKAILILNVTYERLNSMSSIIYLRKENYHWNIECEEVLSIE